MRGTRRAGRRAAAGAVAHAGTRTDPAAQPGAGAAIPEGHGLMSDELNEYGGGADGSRGVLIVTTNDIPGYRVDAVIGEIFGLTVRSRHLGSQIGAGLKSMVGGELRGLTKTLVQSRNEAMDRLIQQAQARGANAVLAMRFDVTDAAQTGTEICAYGTAARVSPLG